MGSSGESQSNGAVERCIQTVTAQIRTMKDALEKRYGQEVDSRSSILHWLVRHAASLITRYHVGKDGRTAYERWKGKQHKKELAEFGECVHFRHSMASMKPTKLESQWGDGIWLGLADESDEVYVGTASGIYKTRATKRKQIAERWDTEQLRHMTDAVFPL